MKKRYVFIVGLIIALLLANMSLADELLLSHGGSSNIATANSNDDAACGDWYSGTENLNITNITFAANSVTGNPVSTAALYTNNSGDPGSIIFDQFTNFTITGNQWFNITPTSDLVLNASTWYWFCHVGADWAEGTDFFTFQGDNTGVEVNLSYRTNGGAWQTAALYNNNWRLYGTNTSSPPPPTITNASYHQVNVSNLYNDTPIQGINITFSSGQSNLTDSNGVTRVYNNSGNLTYTVGNVTLFLNNGSGSVVENGTGLAGLFEGYVNVTNVSRIIDGQQLGVGVGAWAVNTTQKNYSECSGTYPCLIYLKTGFNALTLSYDGTSDYYDLGFNHTLALLEVNTTNVTGVYDNIFNITANNYTGGSLSNFWVNLTTDDFPSYNTLINTSSGQALFYLLQGFNYTFDADATTYASSNVTLPANASSNAYTFTLFQTNTITFRFFDQTTLAKITGINISLEIYSDDESRNYTTNVGEVNATVLIPGAYTARFVAAGYEQNFYEFQVLDDTYDTIDLFMINASESSTVTMTVLNELGQVVEGATIYVQRYDITNNTFQNVTIRTTNFEGQATAEMELNGEDYRFLIFYGGDLKYSGTRTQIYDTTLEFTIILGSLPGTTRSNSTGFDYMFAPFPQHIANGTSTAFSFNFTSNYFNITSCNFYLLNASNRAVIATNSSFCSGNSGVGYLTYAPTVDIIAQAQLAGTGFNNTYEMYFNVVNQTSSNYTLQVMIDDIEAFNGAGFNSKGRFFVAAIIIIVTTIFVAQANVFTDNPEILLLFVFFLTLGFSYINWLYIDLPLIPSESLKQYFLTLVIGGLTVIAGWRKMGVSQ